MQKAKAAVFQGVGAPFAIKEYGVAPPGQGVALIRMIASGVCGTDIHIHLGKIQVPVPMIIGHEFVGEVSQISEADSEACGVGAGDNVIVCVASPCGKCKLCLGGDDANCVNMGVTYAKSPDDAPHLHGGFSEYTYSPVANMIKIPPELDPVMTCVFACAGPTALHAFRLAEQANCGVEKADVAVVQGLGPVGQFAVMYLASLKIPRIFALTPGGNAERESLAKQLGATDVLSFDKNSVEECTKIIRSANGGIGADVVFEASGSRDAFPQGLAMLRNRGAYLVPGQYSNSGGVEIAPQTITFNALHILGSSQYSICDVEKYIEFLRENAHLHGIIKMLCKAYKLEDINRAFDDAKSGGNIKTILAV